jgi:hypothetical protein
MIDENYTRIQYWLCITENGDCEGGNRHLFEGRSRAVFIFIAGDCTILVTTSANLSFFQ